MLVDLEKKKIQFLSDANISKAVVVCSHERSGTHFLMNSIALNSLYSVEPFVDFEYMHLGDVINFHKSDHVSNFIKKIAFIKKKRHKIWVIKFDQITPSSIHFQKFI